MSAARTRNWALWSDRRSNSRSRAFSRRTLDRARPISTSSDRKIASETSWSPVVFDAAEKNSDTSMMGTISASAAAVMTSWPNLVDSSFASFSIGSSSPAEVDMSMVASSSGWVGSPASQKTYAHSSASTTESAKAEPASRASGPRSRSTSISSPARNSSMPRPRSLSTCTGASMRTQPSTEGPTTTPAITSSTAPGSGSLGSKPSSTGARTAITAMIRTLLNEMASMRPLSGSRDPLPCTSMQPPARSFGTRRDEGFFIELGRAEVVRAAGLGTIRRRRPSAGSGQGLGMGA